MDPVLEADAGVGGAELGAGGTESVSLGGTGGAGSTAGAAGTSSQGGSNQGGAGGSDVGMGGAGQAGSDQGQGGADVVEQGGTGGTSNQGGTDAGTGGTDVGQGGSDQGGTGGTDGEPAPECDYQGGECVGLLYKECDVGEYFETECEYNCDPNVGGCFGDCTNGDTRCSDGAAQACVDGAWMTTEQCAFQCVNAACEGACTPGTVACDGLSRVTCGSDFHYGSPVACPTDPNGTTSCTNDTCDLQPIACSAGTADCDGNWSCETDLTSTATCGSCDTACPTRANATATCTGTCGFTCNAGFEDCDGDPSNGCELDTRADSLNCGACGNSCYGGSCTAGECQYDFSVVSDFTGESFTSDVRALTVGANHVYWLTGSELRRAPKTGGTYETLTAVATPSGADGARTGGLVLEAGMLAWPTLNGVFVMPEAGGTATRISLNTRIQGVTGAAGKLYWNDSQFASGNSCRDSNFSNESAFRACAAAKTTTFSARDLTTNVETTWQLTGSEHSAPLAVIGNEMFVAEYQPIFINSHSEYNIRILARDVATGAPIRIVASSVVLPSSGNVYSMRQQLEGAAFTADTFVYTSKLGRGDTSSAEAVVVGPTVSADAPRDTNTVLEPVFATALTLDGSAAFYANISGVYSVSLEGGAPHPFFHNATGKVMQIAVDDAYIYFSAYATNGEQAILRAPK